MHRGMSMEKKLTISVLEMAQLLGISRMTAYVAVRNGTIPSLRIGRRVLISRAALDRWLAETNRDETVLSGSQPVNYINELGDVAR
jgi:excisionase family DNA binding protein